VIQVSEKEREIIGFDFRYAERREQRMEGFGGFVYVSTQFAESLLG